MKYSADGLIGAADGMAERGDGGIEHEAVAVAFEPVEVARAGGFVVGKAGALKGEALLQTQRGTSEFASEADIE